MIVPLAGPPPGFTDTVQIKHLKTHLYKYDCSLHVHRKTDH